MQAIGYCRVSTDAQATDGISLDAQSDRIRQWCEGNGHELTACHEDSGISGKRAANRPGLLAAVAAARRQRCLLVVCSLSRLARSIRDCLDLSEKLDRSGASLVSLSESLDTSNAAGRLMFAMLASMGQFEREVIGERTRDALAAKKARGERIGQIPYGYKLAADGIHLEKHAHETACVAIMIEKRNRGLSLRKLAAELNDQGWRNKSGKPWVASQVYNTLKYHASDAA